MVPGLLDDDAGRVGPDQPAANQGFGVVGTGPDHEPGQGRGAGGVDLAATDPPAFGRAAGDGGGQSAAGRCAQVGLDPQRVDQGAVADRLADHPLLQVFGPARAALHRGVEQVLHDQHQRGGRLAPGDGRNHLQGGGQVCLQAAQAPGRGQGQQARIAQGLEIGGREAGVAIVRRGRGGEGGGEAGQDRVEVGRGGRSASAGSRISGDDREGHGKWPLDELLRRMRPCSQKAV